MAATPASMLRIITDGLQDRSRLNPPKGQPSVQFYSAVIRPRTRWASQWRRVEFDNLADFGKKATVTLPVLGELITRATLVIDLPDIYTPQATAAAAVTAPDTLIGPRWNWTNAVGHAICSDVEFSIGSQVIDRLDSRLLEVIDEQEAPVEHFDSTNRMIARNPSTYTGAATAAQKTQSLEIVFPFWWNRGPGPQALPIQALARDKVQLTVTFRSMQECVYTDARVDRRNPGEESRQAGPMPLIAGCGFYKTEAAPSGVPIYNIARGSTPTGTVLTGQSMPTEWHFRDAYWVVEYISLEDREAAAFRMADLQIPITQHVAVPVTPTGGASSVRIPLSQGGLVRDITWVAQRPETADYNAYFLFSRDLAVPGAAPTEIPWWPDARIPSWDYGDGYVRPGFSDRRSDPVAAATLWTRGIRRFEHEGPSFFRGLGPAQSCQRTPLIDRYIYRYDFGFWPTGGLGEALEMADDEVRGYSNWDKLTPKELALTLNTDVCTYNKFVPGQYGTKQDFNATGGILHTVALAPEYDVLQFRLEGGLAGGVVSGLLNLAQLRSLFGADINIVVRTVIDASGGGGSAALLVQKPVGASFSYTWLAVAGGGGKGIRVFMGPTNYYSGGRGSSATEIGVRGDGIQTHIDSGEIPPLYGGAGGGRGAEAGVGQPDGTSMPVPPSHAFVTGGASTGGKTHTYVGGDGYTGGGSGEAMGTLPGAGGGGGSYASVYVTELSSRAGLAEDYNHDANATVTPMRSLDSMSTTYNFNIYAWLTTYNVLRITNGHGALLFST